MRNSRKEDVQLIQVEQLYRQIKHKLSANYNEQIL